MTGDHCNDYPADRIQFVPSLMTKRPTQAVLDKYVRVTAERYNQLVAAKAIDPNDPTVEVLR